MRIGLASTDQLYFASGFLDCPGAMFTASHNPAAYNGIKLCRAGAKPVGDDTGLSIIRDDLIARSPPYVATRGPNPVGPTRWGFVWAPLYQDVTNRYALFQTVGSYEIWQRSNQP